MSSAEYAGRRVWLRRMPLAFAALSVTIIVALVASEGLAASSRPDQRSDGADLIITNGKIVTMDDYSVSTEVGTIASAMAVRDGTIIAVGGNEVMRYRGRDTNVIDLGGRTVLPGFIDTHSHPHEYAEGANREQLQALFPELEETRVVGDTPEAVMADLETKLAERVARAEPGTWIRLQIANTDVGLELYLDRTLNRAELDEIAPDNPVVVRISVNRVVNSAAMDLIVEEYGEVVWLHAESGGEEGVAQGRIPHNPTGRDIPTDFIMGGHPEVLLEPFKGELENMARFGATTVHSTVTNMTAHRALQELNRRGEMPIRFGWSHALQPLDPRFHGRLGDLRNSDSPFFWNTGVSTASIDKSFPRICTDVAGFEEFRICQLEEGFISREVVYEMVLNGGRITGTHVAGDGALDLLMDIIEQASAEAGFTPEEIRAMRHVSDHCTFNPRPDQIPRLRELGIIMSCAPKYIANAGPRVAGIAGPEFERQVVPVRMLIEGGVRTVGEIDNRLSPESSFYSHIDLLVNRELDDGTVFVPEERIDRVWAMKMFTNWASEYVAKEDELGSLEVGKTADFQVIDRDYFSVPEDEIDSIQVDLTVVGGEEVWRSP